MSLCLKEVIESFLLPRTDVCVFLFINYKEAGVCYVYLWCILAELLYETKGLLVAFLLVTEFDANLFKLGPLFKFKVTVFLFMVGLLFFTSWWELRLFPSNLEVPTHDFVTDSFLAEHLEEVSVLSQDFSSLSFFSKTSLSLSLS